MSNNFVQLMTDFQKNIQALNDILMGDEFDSVSIDGVLKPSISKDVKDKMDSFNALVQGRRPFATLSELNASGVPSAEGLAEVWADTIENNGVYGWNGSNWQKSTNDPVSKIKSLGRLERNSGAGYPLKKMVRNGIESAAHDLMNEFVLDVKVI
ncbi:hypothetical protein, partial [Shewanella surugensis]